MKVELDGRMALVAGRDGAITEAVVAALVVNGANIERIAGTGPGTSAKVPDILVVVHDLAADGAATDAADLVAATERIGAAMLERGGRVIILTTSFGLLPARRHAAQSVATAATVAAMRALAMRLGPKVQVNAVGAGAIADGANGFAAGAETLLSHVPLGVAGSIDDIVNGVLFLADPMNSYMTGQVLAIDGGWGAGYGRNF